MDVPSVLVPYEVGLVVYPPSLPDLGTYMKVKGRLIRHCEDSFPDYDDEIVMKWLRDRGEDLSYYSHYGVTNITKEYTRTALARYDRPLDPFSEDVKKLYDIAAEWLFLEFGPYMSNSRVLSSEAVEAHLRDDKSPGIPWTLVGIHTKGDYFTAKCDFYCKYWDVLATDDYIRTLCSSSGKEEIRPMEKVSVGKIRSTISMEASHVKAHCQLTLDQNEMLMKSVGKHSSYLGLVMQYGGWDKLNTRMSRFAPVPSTLELDGKEYDARYRWLLFQKVCAFRFRCLRREDQTHDNWVRLQNIYREVCFGLLVDSDGHVYSRQCGNPSGQACTTPDNIFKNFMDIVVMWHIIMPSSYHKFEFFKQLLVMCIVGDDLNVSVHPSIQHVFNWQSISSNMHLIDMVYTTPCENFRHNHECEFLSHGFEESMGVYLPVISCQKMRTSMLRFNTSGTLQETIIRACGLRNETFACAHCRHWFSELIEYLRKYSRPFDCVDAWKLYKSDAELWSLYTGYKYSDVCAALHRAVGPPEYKTASSQSTFYSQSYSPYLYMTKSVKKKVKKAAKKEAVREIKKVLSKPKHRMRKQRVLHGKGGYWGDVGKQLGGHLGGVADSIVGIGKTLTGRGAYRVRGNSLLETGGPPTIKNTKHTSTVRHREFLGDITGSSSFNILQYPINPGVAVTFPWLCSIAAGYEQYRIDGMVFEFHSTSGTSVGSTNTALGTVIMATEYNSNLPAFTNKMQMENHEYATTVCPDRSADHPIECARSRTVLDELYVRLNQSADARGTTTTPTTYSPLLYDLGQFYIATYGMQAAAVVGELWVSYEITFFKPTLATTISNGAITHYYWDSSIGTAPVSGTFFKSLRNKNTGVVLPNVNGIAFPTGRWLMAIQFTQSSSASTVNVPTITGGSLLAMFDTNASTGVSADSFFVSPPSGTATTAVTWLIAFDITAQANGSFSFGTFTSGTIATLDVFWMNYPAGFTFPESRKAVDWDPVAVLSRRINDLESKLSVIDEEEEKYVSSECSTPIHIEPPLPDLSKSQHDFASSLLTRLTMRDRAVTQRTAVSHAA
jgi:hypothetical protein